MMSGLWKCALLLSLIVIINISLAEGYYYSAGEGDRDNLNNLQIKQVQISNQKKKAQWVSATKGHGTVPSCAVIVGWNSAHHPIYLGRVNYAGNQLPAKVAAFNNYVGTQHDGLEHSLESYEALCYGNLAWIPFNGEIPNYAVNVGQMANGESVYVGRGMWNGELEPGMVLKSDKALHLPNAGKSHRISNFELLINLDRLQLLAISQGSPDSHGCITPFK